MSNPYTEPSWEGPDEQRALEAQWRAQQLEAIVEIRALLARVHPTIPDLEGLMEEITAVLLDPA